MLVGEKLAVFSAHMSTQDLKKRCFLVPSKVMTKLQDGENLSYTPMYQQLKEQFNVGVTMGCLRHRLIKDFGYARSAIGFATTICRSVLLHIYLCVVGVQPIALSLFTRQYIFYNCLSLYDVNHAPRKLCFMD